MKFLILLYLVVLTSAGMVFSSNESESVPESKRSIEDSYENKVILITVGQDDLVNEQAFKFFRRTLKRVDAEKARAVIFELNTPGGYAHLTTELMMNEMSNLTVPSFAFVNDEATSAGALIAVATDSIYMAPISTIGSAAIVDGSGVAIEETMRAKLDSAFDAFVRSVVKKKGHNIEVVQAMMFPKREFTFGEIKVSEGELLNLTADEAAAEFEGEPLLAKGIVASIEELMEREGLGEVELIEAEMTPFEGFAYFIGTYGGVLILIGLAAGYFEMKTPGFGIGALVAIVAFALFFFGNNVAGNLAGYEMAAIFVLGVLLILLDIFLFPGTFVLGFMGLLLLLGSLLFAMVDELSWQDWRLREVDIDLWSVLAGPSVALAAALLGSMVLMALMMRFLPDLPFVNRYLLPTAVAGGNTLSDLEGGVHESRVDWTGVAATDLRPAGKAEFAGDILDVTCGEGFIAKGKAVRIVSEDVMKIVVKENV